jgi:acetyl-CoA carboxylase / biotin carboxylase 1
LEANGAASVKYRSNDLIATMHRLDQQIMALDQELRTATNGATESIRASIVAREQMLLPVYSQIAVQFCELHDTPGRMMAVGVIEREVEWKEARSFFYWRLRRKLAEFDMRRQLLEAGTVGRGVKNLTSLEATELVKSWFMDSPGMREEQWRDDKLVLSWMAHHHHHLEEKIIGYTRTVVSEEVFRVLTAGGGTARVGLAGIAEGIGRALETLSAVDKEQTMKLLSEVVLKYK